MNEQTDKGQSLVCRIWPHPHEDLYCSCWLPWLYNDMTHLHHQPIYPPYLLHGQLTARWCPTTLCGPNPASEESWSPHGGHCHISCRIITSGINQHQPRTTLSHSVQSAITLCPSLPQKLPPMLFPSSWVQTEVYSFVDWQNRTASHWIQHYVLRI